MIIGKLKPFDEIVSSIQGYKNILVLGCGGCVTVCLSGGDREAQALARDLSTHEEPDSPGRSIHVKTIERQCEADMVRTFLEIPPDVEAIVSLACGAGVQTVAEVFGHLRVLPGLNTTFLGALDEPGVWREKCQGCGDCVLTHTAGVCPIARCAKHLLNGPCGGSREGKCEISGDTECAWQLIVDRLKKMGRLHDYGKILSPKNWSSDGDGGPRSMRRTANVPE